MTDVELYAARRLDIRIDWSSLLDGVGQLQRGGHDHRTDDRGRYARIGEAAYYGHHCAECGASFAAAEAVWRVSYMKPTESMFGIYDAHFAVAPVCGACWMAPRPWGDRLRLCGDRQAEGSHHPPLESCRGCGRPVCCGGNYRRRWVACCERCRLDALLAHHHEQRERRRHRCLTCGELFRPSRSDARYCSQACRQGAYRKRQSDRENRRAADASMLRSYEARLQ